MFTENHDIINDAAALLTFRFMVVWHGGDMISASDSHIKISRVRHSTAAPGCATVHCRATTG